MKPNLQRMFKLSCISTNVKHTRFDLFDSEGANCGQITILTIDIVYFIGRAWNDSIEWNGIIPESIK